MDGEREFGVVLGDCDALGCRFEDFADLFELAFGEGDGEADDGRVREGGVVLAADDLHGHVGLQVEGHNLDLFFARVNAVLGELFGVIVLEGAVLDADGRAAGVIRIEALRVALGNRVGGADLDVGDEVGGLFALGGDGEGGGADVELGAEGGQDRVEDRGLSGAFLQAHRLGKGFNDVDVIADGGLAVFGEVFTGSVVRGGTVAQHTAIFDRLGDEGSDFF